MTDRAHCRECDADLPLDRELQLCTPCHAAYTARWRSGMTLQPTPEFPGVDIDAIHRKWKNR